MSDSLSDISSISFISFMAHNGLMKTTVDRLDPAQLKPGEIEALESILGESPSLVGREGFRMALPDPIFHLLIQVVKAMKRGESVVLMPQNEELSTKAAAEYLGVSRPFVVKLIEAGELPAHKVGAHRRVRLADLELYRSQRDAKRRQALSGLFGRIAAEGHYEDVLR